VRNTTSGIGLRKDATCARRKLKREGQGKRTTLHSRLNRTETDNIRMEAGLQSILQENLYFVKRRELIERIEKALTQELGAPVAVASYVSNTVNPAVQAATSMSLSHIAYVDDLIRGATEGGVVRKFALIVESYGGEATFPLEVMKRAKTYCDQFIVIVVNVAKSAATLLSLLSDKIIAFETASFGPVDPQLIFSTQQGPQSTSARAVKEMMEKTIPAYTKQMSSGERAIVYASQNYLLYQQALDSIKLVEGVIDTQLKQRIDAEKLKELKTLLVYAPASHSLNVSAEEIHGLGFDVKIVRPQDELGKLLVEYHRRALRSLIAEVQSGTVGLVLFESQKISLLLNAQLNLMGQPPTRSQQG
jgi:ATP-dependent protease ClpP protease subunit